MNLGAGVVGGGLGLILVSFAVFMAHDARPQDELRIQLIVGGFTLMLFALIGAGAIWWVKRRGRRLDRGFADPSVEAAQVQPNLRSWRGLFRGRPFNAWVARGPRLELYLECNVATRGAIRRVGPTIRKIGNLLDSKMRPASPPPSLADCEVLSHDPDWLDRLLSRPKAAAAAAELMSRSSRVLPGIRFDPSSVGYIRQFVPLVEMDAQRIDGWLERLAELADAVDAVGPSSDGLTPSRLETWARKSRRLPVHPLWIGAGCAVLGIAVFLAAAFGIFAVVEWYK